MWSDTDRPDAYPEVPMKLYEFGPVRSIRARWMLQEAQLLGGWPILRSYVERMYARPRAPRRIADYFREIRSGSAGAAARA